MTVDQVHERIAEIRTTANDPSEARTLRTLLYVDVLRAVAEDTAEPSPQHLAAAALGATRIVLPRWSI